MTRALVFLLFAACNQTSSGACTHCPSFSYIDTEACAEQAEELGCASGQVVEVTDDACGVGQEPTTHMQCEYTDCPIDADFDCAQFAGI